MRLRESEREQNCEATGAGAQVERFGNFALADPRRKFFAQKLGDKRTGNDHALVYVKAVIAEPRFVREVGSRFPRIDSFIYERVDASSLFSRQNPI